MKTIFSFSLFILFQVSFAQHTALHDSLFRNGHYEMRVRDIQFDLAKTTLRQESNAVLDELFVLLNDKRFKKIEIGVHTISRGAADYNLKLSQGRADNIVTYLVNKGISKKIIVAKGYGEKEWDPKLCTGGEEGGRTDNNKKVVVVIWK